MRMHLFGYLALMLAAPVLAQEVPQTDEPLADEPVSEILVTGRRGLIPSVPDAIDYYKKYCFEANRLTRHSAMPTDDLDWQSIDAAKLAWFGKVAPGGTVYGLGNADTGQTLFLVFEQPVHKNGIKEERCTLIVSGGTDQASFVGRISDVFHGMPTQRHVGDSAGVPQIRGWKQWLWTGMPSRGSNAWRGFALDGSHTASRDTWLVITSDEYYDRYDYTMAELKTKTDSKVPISIVSFAYISRGPK